MASHSKFKLKSFLYDHDKKTYLSDVKLIAYLFETSSAGKETYAIEVYKEDVGDDRYPMFICGNYELSKADFSIWIAYLSKGTDELQILTEIMGGKCRMEFKKNLEMELDAIRMFVVAFDNVIEYLVDKEFEHRDAAKNLAPRGTTMTLSTSTQATIPSAIGTTQTQATTKAAAKPDESKKYDKDFLEEVRKVVSQHEIPFQKEHEPALKQLDIFNDGQNGNRRNIGGTREARRVPTKVQDWSQPKGNSKVQTFVEEQSDLEEEFLEAQEHAKTSAHPPIKQPDGIDREEAERFRNFSTNQRPVYTTSSPTSFVSEKMSHVDPKSLSKWTEMKTAVQEVIKGPEGKKCFIKDGGEEWHENLPGKTNAVPSDREDRQRISSGMSQKSGSSTRGGLSTARESHDEFGSHENLRPKRKLEDAFEHSARSGGQAFRGGRGGYASKHNEGYEARVSRPTIGSWPADQPSDSQRGQFTQSYGPTSGGQKNYSYDTNGPSTRGSFGTGQRGGYSTSQYGSGNQRGGGGFVSNRDSGSRSYGAQKADQTLGMDGQW